MKAALWLRVSTSEQTTDNQRLQLEAEANRRGFEVVQIFDTTASAYTGKQEAMLTELIASAAAKRFDVLLVAALDRLDRRGITATLGVVERLLNAGVTVVSLREPWLEQSGPMRSLLVAICAWVAEQESAIRSERVRAGLARRKAQGLAVGRMKGAKDKAQRDRSGYYKRQELDRRAKQTRLSSST